MAVLPERGPFCQHTWEEGSTVTSHKQMHGRDALVTAVDVNTLIGACVHVRGLWDTEYAAGVAAGCMFWGFPFNLRLSRAAQGDWVTRVDNQSREVRVDHWGC